MKEKENISAELLETIERYYNGSMAKEEQEQFEEKLRKDESFQQEVDDIKSLLLAIETQALKEKIEVFHEDLPIQMKTESSTSKVRFLHFRNIAAAVIIIAGSASFWFFNDSSNEKTYKEFFKPDPGLPTTMSTTSEYSFYDAMVIYKRGDYKTAISKWEKLEVKSPHNDTLVYFLGVANMADKQLDKAIPYLVKTSENKSSVFQQDANYYLGLAYLKKDNKTEAIRYLNSSNSEQSKKLLEQLK